MPLSADRSRFTRRIGPQANWRAVFRRATAVAAAAMLALTMLAAAPSAAVAEPAAPSSAPATPTDAPAATHTITYDDSSFMVDGERVNLWSGEFHYFRLPSQDLWRDVLEKMKAAGFNAVSLYFDWGYHSPKQGVYAFTGVRDVDKLLDMANDLGIYVIAPAGTCPATTPADGTTPASPPPTPPRASPGTRQRRIWQRRRIRTPRWA